MRRVVITGLGAVSCLGNSKEDITESLRLGRSGIVANEEFKEMGLRSQVSGSVNIDTKELIDRKVLQLGLDALESKFAHMRFEPAGWTGNPDIPNAKSVVDYIFRWLGIQFIPGYREANTPQREAAAETKSAAEGNEGDSAEPNANTAADVVRELTAIASAAGNGQGSTTNTLTGNELQLAEDGETPQVRSQQFANFQADAPACDNCGAITVRNGNCYLCHNCGNSMGCS